MFEFEVKTSEERGREKVKDFSAVLTYIGKDCRYSERSNKINTFLLCHKENIINNLTEIQSTAS